MRQQRLQATDAVARLAAAYDREPAGDDLAERATGRHEQPQTLQISPSVQRIYADTGTLQTTVEMIDNRNAEVIGQGDAGNARDQSLTAVRLMAHTPTATATWLSPYGSPICHVVS
jgi:hypothetical protein